MTREEYQDKILKAFGSKMKDHQTAQPQKYPQGYFKVKKCKVCGKEFTPKAPSEFTCSDICKEYAHVDHYYKRNYHISLKEYLDMAEQQNFVCAICGKPNFAMGECHTGCLVVDHDHITKKVRGLLCHNCNRAIGLLHDSTSLLSNAKTYLEGATTS